MGVSSLFCRCVCEGRRARRGRVNMRGGDGRSESRAASWQVTKRTLSTTKAAEPAGSGGIKARGVDPAAAFRERSAKGSDLGVGFTDAVSGGPRLTANAGFVLNRRRMRRSGSG